MKIGIGQRAQLLGLECSGRVVSLGAGVETWSVGDEVCALLAGGGYAEKVAVPAAQLLPVPEGVDLVTAAGLPEVVCTVWSNVVHTGRLAAGETFLVHGGTSGIGTHAIQLAKALGARVAATAGAPDRLERCRALGADIAIDYHDDVPARLKEATDGHGDYFQADKAWLYIVILSVGYMVSRGLAKSGTRHHDDA